jgi:hypothetical protein
MTNQTKYVIRSMSTTDYDVRTGQGSEPFHIYLMPSAKRAGAYWGGKFAGEVFDTPQAADVEAKRSLPDGRYQIAMLDDRTMPTYWELRC